MSEEIQKKDAAVVVMEPREDAPDFHRPVPGHGANVGAVAVESERAIAEAQGQLVLAKRFPRDMNAAYQDLMEACRHPALAEAAFYAVPNRGSGISIRLAEEIARVYGNFEYGHRELSRTEDRSEVEVYAWDKEKNNRSVRHITIMHTRDTKEGQKKLRDQKDIDDKIANVAAKQMRGRILALVPKWFSEAAQAECRKTLSGKTDEPIQHRVRKMVDAFRKFGVSEDLIKDRLGHSIESMTADELVDLRAIYNSLSDGGRVADYFGVSAAPANDEATPPPASKGGLKGKIAAKKAAATTTPPPSEEAETEDAPADPFGQEGE